MDNTHPFKEAGGSAPDPGNAGVGRGTNVKCTARFTLTGRWFNKFYLNTLKNFLLALTALLLPYLASAQFSVSGRVVDAQTGASLPGATVTILNAKTNAVTDGAGAYRLTNVAAGSYTIRVSYVGYNTSQKALTVNSDKQLDFSLTTSTNITDEVTVRATRAGTKSPTTFTNLNRGEIEKNNDGRGFEYLLAGTPSAVVASNAGAGFGYTSVRIRGSDPSRTNVTLNGIPMNDAESQGSFFVDMPDLASSTDNIQVQRGVGTSTNGAGAFGASINIQTTTRRDTAYAQLDNSAGSYGTIKNTVSAGTGLLGGHFTVDGRLSRMKSDGYIERASSDLKSYFLSGAYYGKNTVVRANVFSGFERTYQAWNGVPEDSVKFGNRRYNELGYINSTGQYYKNQVDNYNQDYFQALVTQKITNTWSFSGALHYTHGYGYYEEYKNDAELANYGITPVTIGGVPITTTDLARRLWLNNHFYGLTYSFNYKPSDALDFTLGGAYNEYQGDHYSNIQWTQQSTNVGPEYEYSRNDAKKTDFNIFARADFRAGKFLFYGDAQFRRVDYSFLGFDRNLNNVQQSVKLDFFNPKAGITYDVTERSNIYLSAAVAHREPNRNDFVNSSPLSRPKAERLIDFEGGYRVRNQWLSVGVNAYYMYYKDQLILTGSLNDVGEAIRTNADRSYRRGLEVDGRAKLSNHFTWAVAAGLSQAKVKRFDQFLYDSDNDTYVTYSFAKTDLAYSPAFTGSSTFTYLPFKQADIALISRYVGRQFLDNTSTLSRSIDSYFINDLRLGYSFSVKGIKNIGVGLLVNNVFSVKYSADGATYPGIEGGKINNYNYLFPQATRNFLASLSIKF